MSTLAALKAANAPKKGGENFSENVAVKVMKYNVEAGEVHGVRLDNGNEVVVVLREDKDAGNRQFPRPDVNTWAKGEKNKRVKVGEGVILFDRCWEKNGKLTSSWGRTLLHTADEGFVVQGMIRALPPTPATEKRQAGRAKLQHLMTSDAVKVDSIDEMKAAIAKAFEAQVNGGGTGSAYVRLYEPSTGTIVVAPFSRRAAKAEGSEFAGWEPTEETIKRGMEGGNGAIVSQALGAEGVVAEVIPMVTLYYGKNVADNMAKGKIAFHKPFETQAAEGDKKSRYGFSQGTFSLRKREDDDDGKPRPPFVTEVGRANTKSSDLVSISAVVTPVIQPSAEAIAKLAERPGDQGEQASTAAGSDAGEDFLAQRGLGGARFGKDLDQEGAPGADDPLAGLEDLHQDDLHGPNA